MNTITKYLVLLILCLIVSQAKAQEQQKDSTNTNYNPYRENGLAIDRLKEIKKTIEAEEREYLKTEVETINKRLDDGEITSTQAEKLKKEAAKKTCFKYRK